MTRCRPPDALTSSAYTGERAICSSDFSAFTKWLYCPSVAIFLAQYNFSDTDSPFALWRLHTAELCSPRGEVPWNIAVVNHRVLDLSRAMTRTVSVLNVWGFRMHARRFMGFRNVNFVRISVSEPSAFGLRFCEKESSIFSPSRPGGLRSPRESATWGSDVELEAMESEQTGLAFSLPPSPEHVRANSPVEFAHDYLYPSPGAHDTISFGLDDILQTAASDSEDFGPVLTDALPPSGQEARPSTAYSELVDVLSRATDRLSLDWPDEPPESQASKLDERFLSGPNSRPERRKLPFFSDLHQEISRSWKQPFSSRLTNAAAADFTNLVGSVEQGYTAIPVVEDTSLPSFTLFGAFLEVSSPPSN